MQLQTATLILLFSNQQTALLILALLELSIQLLSTLQAQFHSDAVFLLLVT
jgi:hypothetical protein|tara:strand:+ start:407 stop:559 length:153 start_codon:yes stop_codon:yes gene_type:complete